MSLNFFFFTTNLPASRVQWNHGHWRFAPPITVRDGICATKIVHKALVTFEPIEVQKTATTQNYENDLRISNFWLKNQISLKWVDFSPIYSCPRPKSKCLQLVHQWPNPKNGPNHLFLCQYPCFKEWGRSFCDITPGLQPTIPRLQCPSCPIYLLPFNWQDFNSSFHSQSPPQLFWGSLSSLLGHVWQVSW